MGDVSGVFLVKLGCSYVVVGYFEWCIYYNEDDVLVVVKVVIVFKYGLILIVCIGEYFDVCEVGNYVVYNIE